MPTEQETMEMLIGGFSIIMGIAFIIVLMFMFSKKRKPYRVAYGSIIAFLIFFCLATSQILNAIRFDVGHPMASEEISLRLGIAGVLWAVSMIFLLLGIILLSSSKNHKVDPRGK